MATQNLPFRIEGTRDYRNRSLLICRCDHYLCHTGLLSDQCLASEARIGPGPDGYEAQVTNSLTISFNHSMAATAVAEIYNGELPI
jgi:hypothetical protein